MYTYTFIYIYINTLHKKNKISTYKFSRSYRRNWCSKAERRGVDVHVVDVYKESCLFLAREKTICFRDFQRFANLLCPEKPWIGYLCNIKKTTSNSRNRIDNFSGISSLNENYNTNKTSFLVSNQSKETDRKRSTFSIVNYLKYALPMRLVSMTYNGFDIIWNYSGILYNVIYLCKVKIVFV